MKFPKINLESFTVTAAEGTALHGTLPDETNVSADSAIGGDTVDVADLEDVPLEETPLQETSLEQGVPDDMSLEVAPVGETLDRNATLSGTGTTVEQVSAAESSASVVAAPTRPQRAKIPRRRMLDLAHEMARRHNEFLDLFRGEYALSSWVSSLVINALVIGVIVLFAMLFTRPENKRPPLSVIAGIEVDGEQNVSGNISEDINTEEQPIEQLPTAPLASGGASPLTRPDLASLLGRGGNEGSGQGTGTGDAAGVGAAIAKRVEAAGGMGGKMRIAISWDNVNDLDLHIVTPRDERIFFGKMTASCGGVLDVDKNAGAPFTSEAVENIRWLEDVPRSGNYLVQVHYYGQNPGGPQKTPFSVLIEIGSETRVLKGVATPGRLLTVARFDIKDGSLAKLQSILKESDMGEETSVADLAPKNAEARERFAKSALDEALKSTKPSVEIGRLKRIVKSFAGTEAATEAKKRLDELGELAN
ncbi:MAG: hypothetical protein R3C01_13780 [Planctomycetaceae bacterium]